jgi:hypothetical protein
MHMVMSQGVRDYAEQQRRLLGDIASYTARNLSILAGTASQPPAENIPPVVDTEVSAALLLSGGHRPTLILPTGLIARSESLESPAYVPSSESVSSPLTECAEDAESCTALTCSSDSDLHVSSDAILAPSNKVVDAEVSEQVLQSVDESATIAALDANVNEASAADCQTGDVSESGVDVKSSDAQPVSAVTTKTSKLAATVRRKFTVSKAVLPSTAVTTNRTTFSKTDAGSAPVVLFTKVTSPTDDEHSDGTARVCFHALESTESDKDAASSELHLESASSAVASHDIDRLQVDEVSARSKIDSVGNVQHLQNKCVEALTEINTEDEVQQTDRESVQQNITCDTKLLSEGTEPVQTDYEIDTRPMLADSDDYSKITEASDICLQSIPGLQSDTESSAPSATTVCATEKEQPVDCDSLMVNQNNTACDTQGSVNAEDEAAVATARNSSYTADEFQFVDIVDSSFVAMTTSDVTSSDKVLQPSSDMLITSLESEVNAQSAANCGECMPANRLVCVSDDAMSCNASVSDQFSSTGVTLQEGVL